MNLDKIINFEGKRNCSLTLLVPSNLLNKKLLQIEKRIFGLKHENKKKQLLNIINRIKSETKNIDENNELIICCGLDNNSNIEYYQLNPIKKIEDFEYYYDYKFHINKLYKFMFKNIEYISDKDKNLLINNLDDELIIYEKEINKYIENNLISEILYLSNESINLNYIKKSEDHNFQIKLFTFNDIELKEIQKKYGNMIGILHYKINYEI